jgi:hypothetical protein
VIAAETHPDRDDGGNLARYTQATAAYYELSSPWGRSEAFADLLEQAWAEGRYDAYPGYDPGSDPGGDLPLSPGPWQVELGAVPLAELLYLAAQIPARLRRGRPWHLAIRAAVTAGLCLAIVTLFPGRPAATFSVAVVTVAFAVTARNDIAPPTRPARRISPDTKN